MGNQRARAPSTAGRLARLRGVWRSHGYGMLLEVGSTSYRLYEETACSRVFIVEEPLERLAEFFTDVRISPRGRSFRARRATGVTTVRYRRLRALPRLPAAQRSATATEAIWNFDVLWQTFAERYALFEQRGVDWDAARERWRSQLTAGTGSRRLFECCCEMLVPLRDGHVELHTPVGHFHGGDVVASLGDAAGELEEEDVDLVARILEWQRRAATIVRERYLHGGSRRSAGGALEWGRLDGDTGYLAIRRMALLGGRSDDPRGDQRAAAASLARALGELGDVGELVVDLRDNGGGYDGVALRLAGHLIDRKRLAFTKAASKRVGYAPVQRVYVEPRGATRYRGRLTLLTSRLTASAAEVFVLALLQRPQVRRIGEPTHGILSDAMERHLPNGWRLTLSNELYRAADGALYEDVGIPVDRAIPCFDPADLERSRDPILDHLLAR